MAVQTTLSSLSQTAASNGPDGASDPPSALDDQQRYHGSFIATIRDGKGFSAEVDVASAATCDIGGANSPFVRITGTTTITSFGTNYNGPRFIRFGGALVLTHNSSTLILPGGASITTAAGDTCVATPISGGWRVGAYQRATGAPPDGSVSPAALSGGQSGSAPAFAARAWVNFNGSTGVIRASGNVTSVTRNGTGDYTINFTTAMPDANYCIAGTASRNGTTAGTTQAGSAYSLTGNDAATARTTTACRIAVLVNGGDGKFDDAADSTNVNVVIYR